VLGDVLRFLVCSLCGEALAQRDAAVGCRRGHSFDVARQGYVNLLPGGRSVPGGDTPDMVSARAGFLAAGHFAPVAAALAEEAAAAAAVSAAASTTATASNRWLTPPVGKGRAGNSIKSRIATAKLCSPKASPSVPRVLGSVLANHRSSLLLNDSSAVAGFVSTPPSCRGAAPAAARATFR